MIPAHLDVRSMDRLALPIGKDKYAEWVNARLDASVSENPGILVIGGSQSGKTTLQVMMAAIAASRGTIVIIIDPKQRFAKAFRRPRTHQSLPHVLVYSDPIPEIAAREWSGIGQLAIHDQHLRYQADRDADTKILSELDRFPRVLVIVDELGRALEYADKEWNERKPDGYKGDTPLRDYLHESAAMGAEAGHIDCWSNQTAGVHNFPKQNTDTRSLFGQRFAMGNLSEEEQKRAIFGPGVKPPACPVGQRGAGNATFARGKPFRFQAVYEPWESNPGMLYDLAAQGAPILRETGHIDACDRLILGGVPVPRPGKMASHVTGTGLDLLQAETGPEGPAEEPASAVDDEVGPRLLTAPRPRDESVIVGNDDAAEFCGMTRAAFLQNRRRHPIDHTLEKYEGNLPAWRESDLREWARYRQQASRKSSGKAA